MEEEAGSAFHPVLVSERTFGVLRVMAKRQACLLKMTAVRNLSGNAL